MQYNYRSTNKTRLDLQIVDADSATMRALKRQTKRQNYASVGAYMRELVLAFLNSDEEQAAAEDENRPTLSAIAKNNSTDKTSSK